MRDGLSPASFVGGFDKRCLGSGSDVSSFPVSLPQLIRAVVGDCRHVETLQIVCA